MQTEFPGAFALPVSVVVVPPTSNPSTSNPLMTQIVINDDDDAIGAGVGEGTGGAVEEGEEGDLEEALDDWMVMIEVTKIGDEVWEGREAEGEGTIVFGIGCVIEKMMADRVDEADCGGIGVAVDDGCEDDALGVSSPVGRAVAFVDLGIVAVDENSDG